jgi:EVE domain
MAEPRTWILTGSPENLAATAQRDFALIGLKERRRRQAEHVERGDRIVFYVTGVMAFAGSVRVTGELYEDRTPVWPGKPGKPDPYPWRFPTQPELIVDESAWVPAEELAGELDHVRRWPREHWTLAFQGQIRPVSERDATLVMGRLRAAAGVAA